MKGFKTWWQSYGKGHVFNEWNMVAKNSDSKLTHFHGEFRTCSRGGCSGPWRQPLTTTRRLSSAVPPTIQLDLSRTRRVEGYIGLPGTFGVGFGTRLPPSCCHCFNRLLLLSDLGPVLEQSWRHLKRFSSNIIMLFMNFVKLRPDFSFRPNFGNTQILILAEAPLRFVLKVFSVLRRGRARSRLLGPNCSSESNTRCRGVNNKALSIHMYLEIVLIFLQSTQKVKLDFSLL